MNERHVNSIVDQWALRLQAERQLFHFGNGSSESSPSPPFHSQDEVKVNIGVKQPGNTAVFGSEDEAFMEFLSPQQSAPFLIQGKNHTLPEISSLTPW